MSSEDPGKPLTQAAKATLFELLSSSVDDFVTCIDRQRRIVFLNRTRSREPEDMLGQPMESFIAPPYREMAIRCAERAFAGESPQLLEYIVLMGDGTRRFFRTQFSALRVGSEELGILLTRDLTEQRQLEADLAEIVEFRRVVVEHLPDYVVLLDRNRKFAWVNRLAAGHSAGDVIGAPVEQFLVAESLPRARIAIAAAFEEGALGHYEAAGAGDNGASAWYVTRVVPVLRGGKVDNVLLVSSDITEQKRAEHALRETEEQLHRAQRLESLGQLSGGIAHDFNNLLQVIDGNLTYAQDRIAAGKAITEELAQALRATERAAELTSHLLAIGRRKRVDVQRVDLGELVGQSVRMLRRLIPENVRLVYQSPAHPVHVELDAPQFEQVLINLCVNARDAMPNGGTLTVDVAAQGDQVELCVRDTGSGITEAHLPRVFEPFFTTKGAGSGLGLAVAAGIVGAHGGLIVAESDGATFTAMKIRLPRVESGPVATPALRHVSAHGQGTILVAEDEAQVRAQLVRVLTGAGYTVIEAEDGARAVELFRANLGAIDLVLLDMIMPELDGWQAYLQIEALSPGVKVLFSTGYAANVLPPDFAARGARLLSKPFKPHALLAHVHQLLAGSVAAPAERSG
ncbi:MAG: hypothetical protein RLZZ450_1873 [Pseudomonadota bacterium]